MKSKKKGLFYGKVDLKDIGTFYQNHRLTPLRKRKIFQLYFYVLFYRLKRLLLRKQHHQTTKQRYYKKVGSKDIWNFGPESCVNPFANTQVFELE